MSGPDKRSIPGNTVAIHAELPFHGLSSFGGSILSKFECSQMPHPLVDRITFVDTPGVLSREKQRTQRSYDFTCVISWIAAKCDLILLLFDPHELDICDEFMRDISSLQGNDDKIHVVLNKADQVDTQQLMRVYGALMWSLGKVLQTPEVVRVYVGSMNFSRAAKIHAYIISHLKKEMPCMIGKAKTQRRLIDNLEDEFTKVRREFHLPVGDFPSADHLREVLNGYSIDKFEKLRLKMIQTVDDTLGYEIPDLLKNFRNPYD